MHKQVMLRNIDRLYENCTQMDRLFIKIRSIVCPFTLLINEMERHSSFLDMGCGHGLFLHLIKEKNPHAFCVGYDHDETKIMKARRSRPRKNLFFLHEKELHLISDALFDCVSLVDVLYSIPQDRWQEMLLKAYHFLKPGGMILIKETVNTPALKYHLCRFQETIAIHILKYTKGMDLVLPHWSLFQEVIQKSGFENLQHRRVDRYYPWPHHLFVALRPQKMPSSHTIE